VMRLPAATARPGLSVRSSPGSAAHAAHEARLDAKRRGADVTHQRQIVGCGRECFVQAIGRFTRVGLVARDRKEQRPGEHDRRDQPCFGPVRQAVARERQEHRGGGGDLEPVVGRRADLRDRRQRSQRAQEIEPPQALLAAGG